MADRKSVISVAVAAILLCAVTVGTQEAQAWSLGDLFGGESQSNERAPAASQPAPEAPPPSETLSPSEAEELAPRLGSDLGESGEVRVPESRADIQLTFAPLVRRSAPSVVNVYAARAVPQNRSPFAGDPFFGQFFGGPRESRAWKARSAQGSSSIPAASW